MHKGTGRGQWAGKSTVLIEVDQAAVNWAGFRHLPKINLSSIGNSGRRSHPVAILLPAGIMALPQNDASDSTKRSVRKKVCHPRKHGFFLNTQLFLRRKTNCRSIIIWNTRFICNPQGQSRFKKLQITGHTELYWWHLYWHTCAYKERSLLYTVLQDLSSFL